MAPCSAFPFPSLSSDRRFLNKSALKLGINLPASEVAKAKKRATEQARRDSKRNAQDEARRLVAEVEQCEDYASQRRKTEEERQESIRIAAEEARKLPAKPASPIGRGWKIAQKVRPGTKVLLVYLSCLC